MADLTSTLAGLADGATGWGPILRNGLVIINQEAEDAADAAAAAAAAAAGVAGSISAASATAAGVVELATPAEAAAGTDASRAVTPEGLAGVVATRARIVSAGLAVSGRWVATTNPATANLQAGDFVLVVPA